MSKIAKSLQTADSISPLDVKVVVAVSLVSTSAAWDIYLQYHAVVLSLTLVALFFGELLSAPYSDGARLLIYINVVVACLIPLAYLAVFVLPVYGKWAIGLRWEAVLATLLVSTTLVWGVMRDYYAKRAIDPLVPYVVLVLGNIVLVFWLWLQQ